MKSTYRPASSSQRRQVLLQQLRRFGGLSVMTIVFLGSLVVWFWIKKPSTFPIKSVAVYSNYTYISQQSLQQTILPFVERGFFNVRVNALKQAILQLPWVYQVTIQQIWPGQLVIHVFPKQAVARWGNNGLLSAQSVIFYPSPLSFPANLPQFNGPDDQAALMWQQFVQMNTLLKPLNLSITELNVSARHAWTLRLNNGIEVDLGQTDILQRLQRFVFVYPQIIAEQDAKVASVDLRYPNGLAVQLQKN